MARAMPDVPPDNRCPRQCHIAKCVQHFVTHGLIRVAQTTGRQNLIPVYNNRVFQRSTKGKAIGTQRFNVTVAAERAAVTQLSHERPIGKVQ